MAFDRAKYWREYRERNAGKYQLKRSGKIRKKSKMLQAATRKYAAVRQDYLQEHLYCEARIPGCMLQATEIHHKKGRIGELLADPENFLAVCRSCHEYIEGHPAEAKVSGFSLNRLDAGKNQH